MEVPSLFTGFILGIMLILVITVLIICMPKSNRINTKTVLCAADIENGSIKTLKSEKRKFDELNSQYGGSQSNSIPKAINESRPNPLNGNIPGPCYTPSGSSIDTSGSDDSYEPSGLANKDLTCYMNSMMQALASSTMLISEYEEIHTLDSQACGPKLTLLIKLLKGINISRKMESKTHINTSILEELMKSVQWTSHSQEDAFQLFSFLLNVIQSDMKDLLSSKKAIPPKLKILHSFSENSQHNKIQDHLGIAIPLCGSFRKKSGVDLSKLLDAFFAPSEIDEGPHWTKLDLYGEAPSVMILHIQANEWSHELGQYVKPRYHINYGETLEYTFTIQIQKDGQRAKEARVRYKLVAVVHHMGGVSGGHYITYRKLGEHWYLTNDEQVDRVDFDCKITPYIMLYEKTKETSITQC